ncbi:ABC transporter ATP-binding protein [Candidatus Saganbacteria bacterium]|nr:ABC transporter ATP-binding protein [Candidatus Saganbacteria bacterium]
MLEVKGLSTSFYQDEVEVKAVNDVSLSVASGESLGVVGESGSGKSTLALSLLRLIYPPGKIVSGEVLFDGQDLLKLSEPEMIKVRGARISMIFQDPFTSLNPVFTVGYQIAEAIALHQGANRKQAWSKAVEMLETVRIPHPALRIRDYPHQFSGGMRQRVMIAMALACRPEILIADEPTTALDVTIQAEILKLLKDLQKELKLSIIYITHNFGIVKQMCERAVVMHLGKVVEEGRIQEIMDNPREAYTKSLIDSLKVLNDRS